MLFCINSTCCVICEVNVGCRLHYNGRLQTLDSWRETSCSLSLPSQRSKCAFSCHVTDSMHADTACTCSMHLSLYNSFLSVSFLAVQLCDWIISLLAIPVVHLLSFIVNCVTLCNVFKIMHCVSLAILSQLSRFHPPAVGTNWPILCWRAVIHQTNKGTIG